MTKRRTTMTIEFDGGMKEVNKIMKLLSGKTHNMSFTIREIEKKKDEFDDFPEAHKEDVLFMNGGKIVTIVKKIDEDMDEDDFLGRSDANEEGGWNEL